MKVAMHDVAKKLALWHTPTFRPIMTHDELEPIMVTAGFAPLPTEAPSLQLRAASAAVAMQWKEYAFRETSSGSMEAPRLRLPFPRIDGLHLLAYKAFFFALEKYMPPIAAHNLFHVRAMPLSRQHDKVSDMAYRTMREPELDGDGIFVYRSITIDQAVMEQIAAMELSNAQSEDDANDSRMKKGCGYRIPIVVVPWDCIKPKRDTKSSDLLA
ncbi:hypothetical protein AXF42_Ash008437 [Apostasia shenzhenica]|uniref:Uncharacterized protein n=1 Tax=Apostasia shenzhenica TaxID=1088818 RepID=A0A2I0AXV0_9ASPA|nr:hypothetical protein AXF42_Ash008437 [Apostasia shenzhenica]